MEGIENYNGVVCVEAGWMIDNAVISAKNYSMMAYRKTLHVVRRGCKNTPALVNWRSLSESMKEKVVRILGDSPENLLKKQEGLLTEHIRKKQSNCEGMAAWDWVNNYKLNDKYLEKDKREKIYNNILIADSIVELYEKTDRATRATGHKMKRSRFWAMMAEEIGCEVSADMPNSMPQSPRKLYQKIEDYKKDGYETFISKKYGNDNARKTDINERALVENLCAAGNKFTDSMVARAYMQITGKEISARRIQQIRKECQLSITPAREGKKEFYNTKAMQVDRERPTMPLKFITLDGWDVEMYYQDEKSYYNRLTVIVVLDAFTDFPLGYAIGEHENNQLNIDAMKNAVHTVKRMFGDYYRMWQVQSDNYGRKVLPQYYKAVCEYYTPAAVGNAKAKPVERYWQRLKSEYFAFFPSYTHSNITSKDQPNTEWLMKHRAEFPSKKELTDIIEKIINLDRSKKIEEYMKAWQDGSENMKVKMDMGKYLMQYGETGSGNMLTANGLKLIRDGKEYKYECMDIEMREHTDEKWVLHYDREDMSMAVAESQDGKYRYMMSAKEKVPMAIVDYTPEDYRKLDKYRTYNKALIEHVTEKAVRRQELAAPLMSKMQIEGDYSAMLLTDRNGQHKDNKYLQREERKMMMIPAGEAAGTEQRKQTAEEIEDEILAQL